MSGMTHQQGWQCPVCRKVHAPWKPTCNCHAPTKTSNYTATGNPTNGLDAFMAEEYRKHRDKLEENK